MEEIDESESANENGSVEDKKEEMIYRLYTERRAASENCIIDHAHCIVFSF